MFHLLLNLNKSIDDTNIRFVGSHDFPKFAAIEGHPVFFDNDKNFKLATDFTIVYPKVYIRESIPLETKFLPLERGYIH